MSFKFQICPEISELSEIRTKIPCSHVGCSGVFANSANLEMHLIKTHGKESCYLDKKANNVEFQFFCPVAGCKYQLTSARATNELRWFSQLKFLKQHYLKVHKVKVLCPSCDKKFISERERDAHLRDECGKSFVCLTCKSLYHSQLALTNHCRRKAHPLHLPNQQSKVVQLEISEQIMIPGLKGERPILPKCSVDSSVDIAAAALSELSRRIVVRGVDKGVQTLSKRRGSVRVKKNAALQTLGRRISAETQTTAVFQRVNPTGKSMETQTLDDNAVDSELMHLSDPKMFEIPFWERRNESATQTLDGLLFPRPELEQIDRLIQQSTIFDDTRSCNIETQTEVEFSEGLMDDPILSNTETQTMSSLDVYSHNCTQTCDDGFFDELVEFADIQTQTWAQHINSHFVSAETQTIF